MTILGQFQQIRDLTSDDEPRVDFRTTTLGDRADCHLGKDRHQRPVLLIRQRSEERPVGPQGVVLENLRLDSHVTCSIESKGGAIDNGQFTIVRCESDDPDIQRIFLYAMESSLHVLGLEQA